jgi:hypothetical protein
VPAWDLEFQYAEQFGIDPQKVRETVTVRTWLRWRLREDARASRQAHERAAQPGVDWASLPPAVIEAMRWADEDEDDSTI